MLCRDIELSVAVTSHTSTPQLVCMQVSRPKRSTDMTAEHAKDNRESGS